jgi:hypothetical protein
LQLGPLPQGVWLTTPSNGEPGRKVLPSPLDPVDAAVHLRFKRSAIRTVEVEEVRSPQGGALQALTPIQQFTRAGRYTMLEPMEKPP